jgi:hypothetical protein
VPPGLERCWEGSPTGGDCGRRAGRGGDGRRGGRQPWAVVMEGAFGADELVAVAVECGGK